MIKGINGAALAWLGMFPLCQGVAFRYVLSAAGVPYRRVLIVARGLRAAAALMAVAVLAWQRAIGAFGGPAWLALASAVAIGIVVYAGGLRVLDPNAFRLAQTSDRALRRPAGGVKGVSSTMRPAELRGSPRIHATLWRSRCDSFGVPKQFAASERVLE